MATKWRNPMRKTLPEQFKEIFDRLDELAVRGSGFSGGGGGGPGGGEDHADVSPNLIRNPGFEDWTLTDCDFWQSAAANDWNAGSNYAQEDTTVYSLPYAVKLGDGSNGSRGIAQESAFRVVPGEAYYVSARLVGADATAEYAIILKALESDGVTEITTGTPLGSNWTYSAALGGWIITGVAGTDWSRVTAPILLEATVCYLRASIQYYQNGSVKYLYADDFSITRGSQLPAFSYSYLTESLEPDVHKLLSLIHTDTLAADVLAGDLIYGNATPKWARLEKGADGEVLKLVLGLPSWEEEGGGTPHALLSATHTDSLPASVIAGDLIYGNATPAWARLAKGTDGQILGMVSGYPAWQLHTPKGTGAAGYLAKWTDANTISVGILYDDGSSIRYFFAPVKEFRIENLAALPAWGNNGRLVFRTSDNVLHWDSGSGWVPASPMSTLLHGYHTDTVAASPVAGDLIYANSTPKWARRPKGADGQLLEMLSGYPTWALTPSIGSLLYAASTVAWSVLAPGTAGYVLTMYAGLPAWRAPPTMTAHTLLGSAWHTDVLNASPTRGALIYGNSTPQWAKLSHPGYSGGFLLTTSTGDIAWMFQPVAGSLLIGGPTPGWLPPSTNGYVLMLTSGYPTWQPSAGGVGGAGTANYLPLWQTSSVLTNSILSQTAESGYTCLNSFRMIYNAAIKWMRGAPPDSPDWSGIRGTYSGSALLFWNTASTFIWRYGDADSGYELARLTLGGNLWIAGKLTEAGCPPEWHRRGISVDVFRGYLRNSIRQTEHCTGEEVYALIRVVLDLDRNVAKLLRRRKIAA